MHVTFARTAERGYATVAVRDDGVAVRVPSFDRPTGLPHDIAHLLVERELGLTQGFWGCVAKGAMFPGMAVVAGRHSPRAAVHSRAVIREAGQHGTEAEVLVGTLLHMAERGLDASWPAARAVLREMWAPAQPARGPLTEGEVQRVCTALRAAERRWRALPVGDSLHERWSVPARRRRPAERHRARQLRRR
jgi:hypothetical protein